MDQSRILIIDDEENIRETMEMALSAAGYRVEAAADGSEGLSKFGAGDVWDLVLLDQRMPGLDGLAVLRQIRERDPAARVVMVTAYGTIELAVDAMKEGAVDFLRKPFGADTLRQVARNVLARPRQTVSESLHALHQLLPAAPAEDEVRLPLIRFRTLNGYEFWPVALPDGQHETEALRVRRAFEVLVSPTETKRCAVDISTSVRELVRSVTNHDFPPDDPFWDTVCRMAFAHQLWRKPELPADVVPIYELTREQLETVRGLAGLGPSVRRQ